MIELRRRFEVFLQKRREEREEKKKKKTRKAFFCFFSEDFCKKTRFFFWGTREDFFGDATKKTKRKKDSERKKITQKLSLFFSFLVVSVLDSWNRYLSILSPSVIDPVVESIDRAALDIRREGLSSFGGDVIKFQELHDAEVGHEELDAVGQDLRSGDRHDERRAVVDGLEGAAALNRSDLTEREGVLEFVRDEGEVRRGNEDGAGDLLAAVHDSGGVVSDELGASSDEFGKVDGELLHSLLVLPITDLAFGRVTSTISGLLNGLNSLAEETTELAEGVLGRRGGSSMSIFFSLLTSAISEGEFELLIGSSFSTSGVWRRSSTIETESENRTTLDLLNVGSHDFFVVVVLVEFLFSIFFLKNTFD